jgi:threonine dehydrogenase-like Zn-dependent dehydrogenase
MRIDMKGLYCDGDSIRLRDDLPAPEPEPGDIVLAVRTAGICDTDLQLARGYLGFRGVLGHEFVGQTEEGQRVTAEINNACRTCPVCLEGRPQHCPNRSVLGILGRDGAMAEYVRVPSVNLHVIPDDLDDRVAVFVEPLAAAFRITEQVELGPDVRMAILGDGKLGLLCAWVARLTGAGVTLVGKHPAKLALAGEGIATRSLDEAATLGKSFDVVADCTGSHSGLPSALALVKPCGTVVLKTTVAGPYTADLAGIVIDEVRVVGSRCGPFPKAIAALADRLVDVRPLIGAEYPLDRAEEAFRAASEKGARKVLIHVEPRGG